MRQMGGWARVPWSLDITDCESQFVTSSDPHSAQWLFDNVRAECDFTRLELEPFSAAEVREFLVANLTPAAFSACLERPDKLAAEVADRVAHDVIQLVGTSAGALQRLLAAVANEWEVAEPDEPHADTMVDAIKRLAKAAFRGL